MFIIRITKGALVVSNLPVRFVGPFLTTTRARRWWDANNPGDWEGEVVPLLSPEPEPIPVGFTIEA